MEEFVKPEYKIPVKEILLPWHLNDDYSYYVVELDGRGIYDEDNATRKKVKHAFAQLRKAFYAYRHSSQERYSENWNYSVTGTSWHLRKNALLYFADWLEFSAPLETLLEQARVRAEQARRAHEQESARWDAHCNFARRFSDMNAALSLFQLDGTATQADIKKRYRHLAKQHHPDVGGDAEQFKRIGAAYRLLTREGSA